MKTELTTEQSQHLFELGVPEEKATSVEFYGAYKTKPIFRLTDLLKILPKEIKNRNDIHMEWHSLIECYVVGYGSIETSRRFAKELIDALYELTVWCLKEQRLKYD